MFAVRRVRHAVSGRVGEEAQRLEATSPSTLRALALPGSRVCSFSCSLLLPLAPLAASWSLACVLACLRGGLLVRLLACSPACSLAGFLLHSLACCNAITASRERPVGEHLDYAVHRFSSSPACLLQRDHSQLRPSSHTAPVEEPLELTLFFSLLFSEAGPQRNA